MAPMVKRLPAMQETQVRFLGGESPLEKELAIHSSTLAWKIPWMEEPDRGCKESDTTERLHLFQYPCLENSIGSGAWQATVLGVAELDTTEQLLEENSCLLIVVND